MHVLSASSPPTGPEVTWWSAAGQTQRLPLTGEFSWRVIGPRRCIGSWDDSYKPCPDAALAPIHAQCASCSGLEDQACVFEPKCMGDPAACSCTFGPEPHVIYCALYGTEPKVGMTLARRLPIRLREQGADAYFVITRVRNRAEARQRETEIRLLHGIPEHVPHWRILPQLARPVPWPQLEARAAAIQARLAPRYSDLETAVHRITDHPMPDALPGRPARVAPEGVHKGVWLGGKGRHLFYRAAPSGSALGRPVLALKATDLVGRFVDTV